MSNSTKNIRFFTFRFSDAGFRPIKKRYILSAAEAKIYDSVYVKCGAFTLHKHRNLIVYSSYMRRILGKTVDQIEDT